MSAMRRFTAGHLSAIGVAILLLGGCQGTVGATNRDGGSGAAGNGSSGAAGNGSSGTAGSNGSGSGGSSMTAGSFGTDGGASSVVVTVQPPTASVPAGGTQQFTATVTGAADTSVTWNASAGKISASGLYTAPQSAGGYVVLATSNADP